MKLSEIKGEKALEVIADLMDPISEILADAECKKMAREGDRLQFIKYLLKHHPKRVITILALIQDENPEEYQPSLISLPKLLMEMLEDPDVNSLFGLRSQTTDLASSGSATVNTEAKEV